MYELYIILYIIIYLLIRKENLHLKSFPVRPPLNLKTRSLSKVSFFIVFY